jgi:hypothetical protein
MKVAYDESADAVYIYIKQDAASEFKEKRPAYFLIICHRKPNRHRTLGSH